MNQVLNYLWEASLSLGALWFFYWLLLDGNTFFDWNRAFLLLAIIASLAFPAIEFPANVAGSQLAASYGFQFPILEFTDQKTLSTEQEWISLPQFLFGVYLIGLIFFLCRLIWGMVVLYRQISKARQAFWGPFILLEHPDFQPASFFRYIFLPAKGGNEVDREWIIAHEAAHGNQLHSWDILLVQLLKIVLWFNPFVRLFEKALREVHEYQVDEKIIAHHSKKTYAQLLLKLLRPTQTCALIHNFNQFQIKKRIKMMNQPKTRSLARSKYALSIPLFGVLFVLFACEYQEEMMEQNDKDDNKITERLMQGDVFDVVEDMPVPNGGMEGWNQYLMENLTYPESAKKEGVEGTVYASFVVNQEGVVRDVELLRGVDDRLNQAALEVIRNSPDWEPGKQKGKEVTVKMRVPIKFKIN
ncbi:M56 family metallopeptidase [Cyclobacterium plantarum]|uniref:M56 family metallopeptidase n=1 Tax=Cyclobacterium plantarum TaxID=2716263 RepID=A0ABX0H9X0_9BACT|nr:M56 family metallopeptidase [Cyclobacterium plantarum]NHE56780.1 M56 family metallopeptidase [Cyclobacterium plantarum]